MSMLTQTKKKLSKQFGVYKTILFFFKTKSYSKHTYNTYKRQNP